MSGLVEDLRALGVDARETSEPYERDESGLGRFAAQAVVLARTAAEVQSVLRFSRARQIPVVPRGAGSGKSGAALAERGGIVLSLEKMDRIVEVSGSHHTEHGTEAFGGVEPRPS